MVHEGIVLKTASGTVNWEWYDQSQGLVKWTFANTGNKQGSYVLMRGAAQGTQNSTVIEAAYVFGTAFNAIYLANPEDFGTHLMTEVSPLVDKGITANSPPMALVTDSSGNRMIAFIFTLGAGQEWSMLEGGFTAGYQPATPTLVPVKFDKVATYCWAWNSIQCEGYNEQSGTNLPCPANPLTISTASFTAEVPLEPEFIDQINDGNCDAGTGKSSGSAGAKTCILQILKGIENQDTEDVIAGIECLLGTLDLTEKLVQHLIWEKIKKLDKL